MKKETKKVFVITVLTLFLFSFLALMVSAQGAADSAAEATAGVMEGIGDVATEIFGPLFGDKEILTRVFFAILLGMIIHSIVSTMFKGKKYTSLFYLCL